MKKTLTILSLMVSFVVGLNAQNTNIDNLLSTGDWSTLFPKRAGVLGSHPQGYTTDFYSYTNFRTAINEMSDYFVSIRKKAGVAGQVVTVNRKSTGVSYEVSSATAYWQSHAGAESTIDVDFGDFINRDSQHNNKRELAAFLANATKETTGGWHDVGSGDVGDHSKWGLYYVEELNSSSCYTSGDANYPAVSGKCYSGRGPLQLSWNYNYGQASHFIFGDKTVLLNNPDAVSNDGVLAFKTAIWFWMMPQCPKPSCHQVMHDLWVAGTGDYSANLMYKRGFAHTNNIINGGLECRTSSSGAFTEKVVLRSQLYLHYLSGMGFSISEVALENTGDYTSSCYVSSSYAMTNYENCDVLEGVTSCLEPSLGSDQTICSASVLLNVGVSIGADESISWFKNNVLLNGASAVNYSPTEAGTYKATITSEGCIRSDEIILTQGGSIQVSSDNNGQFCSAYGPLSSTVSVSGGNGNYNFYTVENGGSPIATGGTLIVDEESVSFGQSQTYYVEESAGETAQIGPGTKITDNSNWVDISSDLGWNKISQIFTAHSAITLESIDFYFGWIGDGNDHTLNVKVFEYGTTNLVGSKEFTYASWDDALWNGDGLNTVELGFDLAAGQYEFVTIESNILLWQTVGESATDIGYGPWTSSGIATLDGAFAPDNPEWGVFKNYNQGTYNWKFSKGGGAGSASCGRVSIMVSHDCPDGYNEIGFDYLEVFPNPAGELININLTNINSSDASVELYNSVGKLVLFKDLVGVTGDNTQIGVGDLERGIYFVKLKSGLTNYASRVVISK